MLRSLLSYAEESPEVNALAEAARREPQRAFVSSSLRPYLLSSLIDLDPERPALVVAGDDRAARDLAADLRAFLAPRQVRFYPARGVRYESHLAPPPHLVGLRVAALDALLGEQPAVLVTSAVALAEKVPDPELRPHGFEIEKGGLLDLEEAADQLVACGYERVDQVENRGQFATRGDILDVYPATEERAVRCELFDVEVERLTWFSTFTQRSLEEAERVEIAPAAELAPEQRELAEIAATSDESERPDVADVLPVDRFRELLDLVPADALIAVAAEEELAPSLRDYWEDVTTSFHDKDAHHLYVAPDRLDAVLQERAELRLSSISQDQPHEFRAQSADTAARSLREAEPELEKLVRSGYRTIVAWARRGEAERARYNLTRVHADFLDGRPASAEPGVTFAHAMLREGFLAPQLKLAILPEHRLLRNRRSESASRPRAGAAAITSFTELRAGGAVVHEDHGIAKFVGFETKTVGGITRDYLELEFKDGDRVFVPSDQLHKVGPLRGRGRRGSAAVEARRQAVGADEAARAARRRGARGRADQPLRRAPPPRRPRLHTRRRVADGARGELPLPRDARPDGRDRGGARGHGGGPPDGPADLRRRGLRQDRGGAAGGLQGGRGRQAGDVPRARRPCSPSSTSAPSPSACATTRCASRWRRASAPPKEMREALTDFADGQGRHHDRHAPPALARRAAEGPRPADRGRGAALRREAEGAAAPAAAARGRALAVGHADPAHAPDVAGRACATSR